MKTFDNRLQTYIEQHRDFDMVNKEQLKIHCKLCYPNRPQKTFDGTDLI